LFRDLLIGVTSFFRDIDAYKALETKVIDQLFINRQADSVIRVWVPGCSTGEEAYSIAMLISERQDKLQQKFKVQLFATDIDSNAIATARAGVFTGNIVADVSPERLHRFFDSESSDTNGIPNTYRIRKSIRDMVIFSEQNVIKDPPFSKLDLISCRNLLIYLGQELQSKLILLFHYSLKPEGFLFIGASETIGEFNAYFNSLDRKEKVFQRVSNVEDQKIILGDFIPTINQQTNQYPQRTIAKDPNSTKITIRELTEKAILKQTAASVLIDAKGDVLYIHGRTGKFLESPQGEFGSNIIKMARSGLAQALTVLLNKAVKELVSVYSYGLKVKTDHDDIIVDLSIHPVLQNPKEELNTYLYLVVFVEVAEVEGSRIKVSDISAFDIEADARVMALTKELKAKEEYLQSSNEELETSNEELKSSIEEMQSINEELQSTNEELETSKEELQSVNEELATVNAELQARVSELSTVNNDMNNLLSGTNIATIFVDLDLLILRFNVAANRIINLILGDIGRPVGHIVSNLIDYDNLVEDIKNVIDTLIAKEITVTNKDLRVYSMRIQPYRTIDNIIKGAVITFTDVTACKLAEQKLKQHETVLSAILKLAHIGSWSWERETQKLSWSDEAYLVYDMNPAEFLDGSQRFFDRSLECYKLEDRSIMTDAFLNLIKNGIAFDLEFSIH
ncbi:MAG: CheR family methyltransferase, partial [Erysipelotrichaceae bacterium]